MCCGRYDPALMGVGRGRADPDTALQLSELHTPSPAPQLAPPAQPTTTNANITRSYQQEAGRRW